MFCKTTIKGVRRRRARVKVSQFCMGTRCNVFLCMKHWSIFFRAVSGHACYSQLVLRVHGCGEPHIASRAKQRSVETQHCLWNVQCALRKLKNVICEVSFSSDSNENDETVLEICYANYENLNWICTRLIEFACPRAFVVKQCPLFVWRNNRITGLFIINICCPLLSGHDALYSANDYCCAKSCYWSWYSNNFVLYYWKGKVYYYWYVRWPRELNALQLQKTPAN